MEWLRNVRQPAAADWYLKHHTGDAYGNWTWADAGIVSITHNMGMENIVKGFIHGTVNANANQKSGAFIASSAKYIADKSLESYDEFAKSPDGLHSFTRRLTMTKEIYDKVQEVHRYTLSSTVVEQLVA